MSFWSEKAAFDPISCSHGSKKAHELICKRAKMSAVKHAMIKQLDINLAWWRVEELHTNSCVEDVDFLSKRYCPVTNSRGNFQRSWKSVCPVVWICSVEHWWHASQHPYSLGLNFSGRAVWHNWILTENKVWQSPQWATVQNKGKSAESMPSYMLILQVDGVEIDP